MSQPVQPFFLSEREKQSFPLFVFLLGSYLGSTDRSDYTVLFLTLCYFHLPRVGHGSKGEGLKDMLCVSGASLG